MKHERGQIGYEPLSVGQAIVHLNWFLDWLMGWGDISVPSNNEISI
jgi:hypothetical protein